MYPDSSHSFIAAAKYFKYNENTKFTTEIIKFLLNIQQYIHT